MSTGVLDVDADQPVPYWPTDQDRATTAARRRASLARFLGLTPGGAQAESDNRCPAYINITGPRDTMHTVRCQRPYGHGAVVDVLPPLHTGRIEATDQYGHPTIATVTWSSR